MLSSLTLPKFALIGKDLSLVLDLLWVAPEILRLPNRPTRGTQKGDVYSFAIILQEFHSRQGPYSSSYMDPKGM